MSEWTNFNNVDDIFRSSTEGLPDNHVITVRERRLDVDIPDLIQNNIKTDTITLDLDAEWEGITPVIILGSADDAVEVYYNGDPVTIPSQVTKEVGWVDCSVTGYDTTGTVRLVTVAAPDTFQVIESGLYTGEVPEEEGTSLLGQLLDAAKDAQAAADSAEDKIDTIDTKLTEVDTKVGELTTVAGNAQTAAQNAQTAAETAQKAAQDAENSVSDAIFTDATAEKPDEKFLTDADGNVLQDVYLATANGVGDKEQYVNIGRSGEINGVVVHGGRAHAQLWTRASADGQHDAYLNMYDTLEDGTQRAVLQAGYQNENTHVTLWDRDNPDARSGSFQPNRLVMADVENDAQADFKPTVGYFDSSGSQAIVMVTDPGENGINAVMGFGNSGTGKVLSRIGVTDGTSVLELNDHTVNDISLDSFADAENPSNKNLVTEKAVAGYVDAATESLPNTLTLSTEGQFELARPNAIVQNGALVDTISISDNTDCLYGGPPYNYVDIGLNTISPTQLQGNHSGVEIKDGRSVARLLADDTMSLSTVELVGVDTEGKEYVGARLQSLGGTGQFFLNDDGSNNNRAVLRPDEITLEQKSSDGSTTSVAYISATNPDDAENKASANLVLGDRTDYANQIALQVYNGTQTLYIGEKGASSITDDASDGDANALATAKAVKDAIDAIPEALPEGGTEGQVLTKTADGKAWQDIPTNEIINGTLTFAEEDSLVEYGKNPPSTVVQNTPDGVATVKRFSITDGNWGNWDAPNTQSYGYRSIIDAQVARAVDGERMSTLDVVSDDWFASLKAGYRVAQLGLGNIIGPGKEPVPKALLDGKDPSLTLRSGDDTDDAPFRVSLNPEEFNMMLANEDGSLASTVQFSAQYPSSRTDNKAYAFFMMGDSKNTAEMIRMQASGGNVAFALGNKIVRGITDTVSDTADGNSLVTDKAVKDAIDAIPDPDFSGYLPKTGGTLTGNVDLNTGTAEPNLSIKRTVDGGATAVEGRLRIDSDGVVGLRSIVGGTTVNNLYLEQTQTRLTKPLNVASGGVPQDGTVGQILKKGQNGAEWVDSIVVDATVADVAARESVAVVDDPANPTSGIVLKTDPETDKTIITGIGDKKVDEIHISDLDSTATDDRVVNKKYVDDAIETQTKKNVLVSTAAGQVAHAEDAFAEKPREVRIKGRTVKNLWPNRTPGSETITVNGITFSIDETGLISVNGSLTDPSITADFSFSTISTTTGKKYTLSSSVPVPKYIEAYAADGSIPDNTYWEVMLKNNMQTSTTTAKTNKASLNIRVKNEDATATAVNASFRVMLVEGSEAPDCFTPTGVHGVEPEKLVVSGKNALPMFDVSDDRVTKQSDGGYRFSGEIGASESYVVLDGGYMSTSYGFPSFLKPNQTYRFSQTGSLKYQIFLYFVNGDTIVISEDHAVCAVPDASMIKTYGVFLYLEPYRNSTVDTVVYPQIELGSTATAYEPPNVTEVTLPETDPLMSINDYADELVIEEDGSARVERIVKTYTANGTESLHFSDEYQECYFSTPDYSGQVTTSITDIICDKLPTVSSTRATTGCSIADNGFIYFMVAGEITDVESAKAWLAENTPTFWFTTTTTTETLSSVTVPELPAPTFNTYPTGGDVPGETSVTYENDVNITISNMQKTIDALLGGN